MIAVLDIYFIVSNLIKMTPVIRKNKDQYLIGSEDKIFVKVFRYFANVIGTKQS